jgi:deoxyadenosine/deoxycytidine kinase
VNLLMEFYRSPERFAYTFQNYVFLTRVMQVAGQQLKHLACMQPPGYT